MTENKDQRLKLPKLAQYRAAAAHRRAVAFSKAPDFVLGCPVKPMTPATFSLLYAVGSPFVRGGTPTEMDVRHYVWFHSALYSHTEKRGWWIRKKIALARFVIELGGWRRLVFWRPNVPRYLLQLTRAIADIQGIIEKAFADSPPSSGRPGRPVATLEAYFIHEFSAAYRWAPERTSNTPLRELIQLHRCIRMARGEEIADEGEDTILAAHLKARNAEAEKRRAGNG